MTKKQNAKNNPSSGKEIFRPYARLISVLGDQLITSKFVAVIELVKNSYDADASGVTVRFAGFDQLGQSPVIEIEDDGDGMTLDIIRDVWMKPATPHKLNKKKSGDKRFTKRGRLMQGDKGVGRFAIYKLGNLIEIFTKTETTDEVKLALNFRDYAQNDEFEDDDAKFEHKFLDQIENEWFINSDPELITNTDGKGTVIRISDLRTEWKRDDLKKLQPAFQRMIPPVIPNFKEQIKRDFDVNLYWNDVPYPISPLSFKDLIEIAPFSFEGDIDDKGKLTFIYKHQKREVIDEIDFFQADEVETHDVWKLPRFRDQFMEESSPVANIKVKKPNNQATKPLRKKWLISRRPITGPFSFYFYAFDLRKNMHELTSVQEEFVKENSVYLYRDFTRVYPYGEQGVDWLLLSKMRAEDRAGRYFSYNDLFGFVFISQEKNPLLRDQASREGLVDVRGASQDFVAIIQATLKVMKDFVDLDKRKEEIRRERAFISANRTFEGAFNDLRKKLESVNEVAALKSAQKLFDATNELVKQYQERIVITQDLAGLGMAVEKSTHDIFMLINKMIQNSNDIVSRFEKNRLSARDLKAFFTDMTENLEFLYQELQILQPLFRESRKTVRDVSVRDVFERIGRYYRREFQFDINYRIEGSDDFQVRSNLGLLLQVFLNLVDNAIYWLKQKSSGKRSIVVQISKENRRVIVADDGPGVEDDLADVIFLEFYSRKAESGRGLGLYIAKELLDRIDANISLMTSSKLKILSGANFLVQFDRD